MKFKNFKFGADLQEGLNIMGFSDPTNSTKAIPTIQRI